MTSRVVVQNGTGTAVAARAQRYSALLSRLEVLAPRLLTATIVLWIVVMFAASVYKYTTYGQGYDQIDFEQGIWNTVHGRMMADSRFNFTGSVFGMDWMPMLLFFVPVYALIPSPHVLFFLQIVASALGALPAYWLARDKLGSKLAGYGAAALYLLFPTLLHTALNPFQVRLFALTLLMYGFYFYERGNWKLFLSCALLAMLARTDVALVVLMFGVYGLLTRRKWVFVVPPLAVGLVYFAIATFYIVPSFAYPGALTPPPPGTPLNMACWPCGLSPQLAYYAHLGNSGPEIIKHIILQPLDTINVTFIQPGLTGPKLFYLLELLLPLALLPLFAPKPLVITLPIVALNMLSLRSSQFDYTSHYSLLMIPPLVFAAIYGADNLLRFIQKRREWPDWAARRLRIVQVGAVLLAVYALVLTIPYKNPVLRTIRSHETQAYVSAANSLIAMIPPEAKVAATSKLAPHLLPRQFIYNFPPAPYSPYNLGARRRADYVNLDYVLVDPKNTSLSSDDNQVDGQNALVLVQTLPDWKLLASKEGILLFQRVGR